MHIEMPPETLQGVSGSSGEHKVDFLKQSDLYLPLNWTVVRMQTLQLQ